MIAPGRLTIGARDPVQAQIRRYGSVARRLRGSTAVSTVDHRWK